MKFILEVDDPEASLLELANIMVQLRDYTKYWEENYGAGPKNRKKFWEKKADEWLNEKIKKEENESK